MSEILKGFWVLEGLDGAGTTTQLKKLEDYLQSKGTGVFRTAEPTIYETGKFIRKVLSGEIKVPQSTIAYLFAADRDNHINNPEYGIISHLKKGEVVISDRYFFSSFAYQSIGFDPD
ncbi:MAG: dTMP kinase, partial [Spirochaetales bacterium]|nr:dTMP kinase [Spirochaetales bacterium]